MRVSAIKDDETIMVSAICSGCNSPKLSPFCSTGENELNQNLSVVWLKFPNVRFRPNASAPSKVRLCQPGEETGTESLGQASGTECCVGSGNADGEAYTGR